MRDTGVYWGHRGEGTGGGGAIITGSKPPPPSPPKPPHHPELPDGTHLNPQWRKQQTHTHTYAYLNTSIVSHIIHMNTGAQTLQKHLKEMPQFSFNRLILQITCFVFLKQMLSHYRSQCNSPSKCSTESTADISRPHAVIETCHHMGAGTLRKCITV